MYSHLLRLITGNQKFIITTHVNPDGDAIGSEMALLEYLEKIGKNVRIINCSQTPYNFRFLDPDNRTEMFNEELHSETINDTDAIMIIDTNDYSRLKSMDGLVKKSKSKKIVIDHHLNTRYEEFDCVISDINSPATAEILFKFFKNIGGEISYKMAICLYTAIMTDTGSFRFDRTTSETHQIAAELINLGVRPFDIYSKVYNRATPEKLHLLGRFLNKIKLEYNGKLAYSYLTEDDFLETNTNEYETDGFSTHLMSLESVILGIVFTKTQNGIKVSFRSKGDIYCNELAKTFGGGGHKNAAGTFTSNEDLNEMINKIISSSQKFITK